MNNDICPICLKKFINCEIINKTNCGHIFHKCCIKTSLNYSQSCPVCRTTISIDNLSDVIYKFDDYRITDLEKEILSLKEDFYNKFNGLKDNLYKKINRIEEQYIIHENLIKDIDKYNRMIIDNLFKNTENINNVKNDIKCITNISKGNIRIVKTNCNNINNLQNSISINKITLENFKKKLRQLGS